MHLCSKLTKWGDLLKFDKRVVKSFISVLIFMAMFSFILPTQAFSARSKPNVAIEAQAGFDGVAKLGTYIPYKVVVINKGEAVDGEVQIEVKIDSSNKTIFSKPVSLAEGASKEVIISAPVFTARKGVKIRYAVKGKSIKEVDFAFKRLVPPEIKTIGVLSSDNSAYDYLNSLMIPWRDNHDYDEKIMAMRAAGVYPGSSAVTIDSEILPTTKVKSVLIPLTDKELPESIEIMNGFDILIISNFDTSILTKAQLDTLDNWVENGGTLVLGTGVNWKKVYNSLPENLKKFLITGTTSENSVKDELEDFIDTQFDKDLKINTVNGDIGFKYQQPKIPEQETVEEETKDGPTSQEDIRKLSLSIDEVLVGSDTNPIAVKYIYQLGRILFLSFDPGMEPFVSWEGRILFWENLLYHSSSIDNIYQRGSGYYYSNYNNSNYYLNDLANQVPEEKKPPLVFMFVMLMVYIVVAGPVMYIILKKKDKRDYTWICVPAVAVLSLVIIYLAGFRTRYKTAVFNTVSIIHLDADNKKTDITTGMGIFNNKRGDLKLTYSQEDNINFDITQASSYSYTYYPDDSEPEGVVVSKIILSEPAIYELYNVSMWEPKYISARKSEPLNNQIINSVQIKDGKIKMVINNTTKYDFLEAFISLGSNFISVGDILSGEQKTIELKLDSREVYGSLYEYLDSKYGRTYYPSNMKPPQDFLEKRRKRNVLENLFQRQYLSIKGRTVIGLYALNNQDMGIDIKINGDKPESFFTNGIFATMSMNFEKGQQVDIPEGVLLPDTSSFELMQAVAYLDSENGITARDKGDIDLTYNIPGEIEPIEFSLDFRTYIPLYVKYNIEDMKASNSNFQTTILQNKYEYFIYDNKNEQWKQINESHTQKENVKDYLDGENNLKVRIRVVEIADTKNSIRGGYTETERLAFPALQLKGVVR